MTTTTTINAPMDAKPGTGPYPERYALVFTGRKVAFTVTMNSYSSGDLSTLVYKTGWAAYVGRTYLRDENGIYTDGRWPASAVAETLEAARSAIHDGELVAVPVSVAKKLFPELPFAEDGRHPALGTALVP